jgi:hypothetical protein
MSDVFVALRDHNDVEQMLVALTHTGGAPDGSGKTAERLVIEEPRHESAEEMHFWPAVGTG